MRKSTPLFRSYGLFWKVEDVFWGKPNSPGNLYGKAIRKKKSIPIDFRDQVGIYVLYFDYKLVYIGQAGNGNASLFKRLKYHCTDTMAGRWNQFSWFGIKQVITGNKLKADKLAIKTDVARALNHLEAMLIHSSEPPLNRQGGRWGKDVVQYIQFRDELNLGKSEEDTLRDIHQKIRDMEGRIGNKIRKSKGN